MNRNEYTIRLTQDERYDLLTIVAALSLQTDTSRALRHFIALTSGYKTDERIYEICDNIWCQLQEGDLS